MILDWREDAKHANLYEILDADTYQPLPMEPPWSDVFYADDSRGLLRVLKRNETGSLFFVEIPGGAKERDLGEGLEVAWEEIRRRIRIVRKRSVVPDIP
jgi:hypothetical protein